jgi:hypothetical protein
MTHSRESFDSFDANEESDVSQLRQSVAAGIESALDDHWQQLKQECDLNLVAAYAEGNLPQGTQERVAIFVAANPYAQAVVESVQQRLASQSSQAMLARAVSSATNEQPQVTPLSPDIQSRKQTSARRLLEEQWRPLIAASLLITCVATYWGWQNVGERTRLREQVAQLDARWKESLERETQMAKSLLARQTAQREPIYLTGASSPSLIAASLEEPTRTRGPEDETPDERATLDRLATAAQQAYQRQAEALRQADTQRRVEQVSLLLLSGKLIEANRELSELESNSDSANAGAIANARGVWNLVGARRAESREEEQRLLEAARRSLRHAGELGEADAWFNLAKLCADQGREADAKEAAARYLNVKDLTPELTQLIRDRFSLSPP